MTNTEARKMIIDLLDDAQGVNNEGYTRLYDFAVDSGNEDVVKRADCQDNRWFLGENDADELRRELPTAHEIMMAQPGGHFDPISVKN